MGILYHKGSCCLVLLKNELIQKSKQLGNDLLYCCKLVQDTVDLLGDLVSFILGILIVL